MPQDRMEDDRKNALARKAEEAERLANENRQQARERERYNAACEGAIRLAMELERKLMKLEADLSALRSFSALAPQSRHVNRATLPHTRPGGLSPEPEISAPRQA